MRFLGRHRCWGKWSSTHSVAVALIVNALVLLEVKRQVGNNSRQVALSAGADAREGSVNWVAGLNKEKMHTKRASLMLVQASSLKCADENHACLCTGTVYFATTHHAASDVGSRGVSTNVTGRIVCIPKLFDRDPEFGSPKMCFCDGILHDPFYEVSSSGNLPRKLSTLAERGAAVVPLLSVSLAVDPNQWLQRLLESIDASIGRVLVQIGNPDEAVLQKMREQVDRAIARNSLYLGDNVELMELDYNPGCSYGWNIGMKPMLAATEAELPWALIVNSDVAFHSGSLAALSQFMTSKIASDPQFGLGHLNIMPEWSGFAATWRLAKAVGLFDENLYPVYYEDNDYSMRLQLSGFRALTIKVANVQHGNQFDGSKNPQSGTAAALKDPTSRSQLSPMLDRCHAAAQRYLGIKFGGTLVPTLFKGPYNSAKVPLSSWPFLPAYRKYIKEGGNLDKVFEEDGPIITKFVNSFITNKSILHPSASYLLASEPTFCAFEGKQCECNGTVLFAPILRGKWGDDACLDDHYAGPTTLDQVLQGPLSKRAITGSVQCEVDGKLPEPKWGVKKYCRCEQAYAPGGGVTKAESRRRWRPGRSVTKLPETSHSINELDTRLGSDTELSHVESLVKCADENHACLCTGTVYFATTHHAASDVGSRGVSTNVNGRIACIPELFDRDPEFGSPKMCFCDGILHKSDPTDILSIPPWSGRPFLTLAAYLDASSMFNLESVNPNKHSKYVVWYPRAGFGNRMMSLVSSIILAVLTDRGLYLATDGEQFDCRSLLNSSVCDWTFPEELNVEFKKPHNFNLNVKGLNPDAYFPAACAPESVHRRAVKTLMCEDLGAISERFIKIDTCQYYAPLMFSNNKHALQLKPLLDAGVFGTIWKPLLGVSDFGGQSTECDVGVHVRDDMPTSQIDSVLLPCLESITARPDSSITLASMWPDVRAHIKKRLGDRVKWFSATKPNHKTSIGANAADPASVATDVRALGLCKRILFSKPTGVEAYSTLTMLMLSLGPPLVSMEQCIAERLTEPTSHLLANDGCNFDKYQEACGYVPKELGEFQTGDSETWDWVGLT